MKKILILILLITVTLFCFAGCSDDVPPESDVYGVLDALVSGVDGFTLSVSTAAGGETLTSSYEVEYTEAGYQVAYSYEVLNKIDLTNPSGEYKSTKSGTALVVGNEIRNHTGDEIDVLPGKLNLHFDETCFSNVIEEEGSFKATVTNAATFLGITETVSDMRMEVSYTQDALSSIVIDYTVDSAEVHVVYTFN